MLWCVVVGCCLNVVVGGCWCCVNVDVIHIGVVVGVGVGVGVGVIVGVGVGWPPLCCGCVHVSCCHRCCRNWCLRGGWLLSVLRVLPLLLLRADCFAN